MLGSKSKTSSADHFHRQHVLRNVFFNLVDSVYMREEQHVEVLLAAASEERNSPASEFEGWHVGNVNSPSTD